MHVFWTSVSHTAKSFWTGKRFLKLMLFALLMGNVTYYCVDQLAKNQILASATQRHHKIYVAHAASSAETFPFYKVEVVTPENVTTEIQRRALAAANNRPTGWSFSTRDDGWALTYYVLPKNVLEVKSYIRDDEKAWEWMAAVIGGYAFALLLAFGWFWTRALDGVGIPIDKTQSEVGKRIALFKQVLTEMDRSLNEVAQALEQAETASHPATTLSRTVQDLASQIRLLAVNGSIEAARGGAQELRVFHVLMEEIHRLAIETKAAADRVETVPTESFKVIRSRMLDLQAMIKDAA